MIVLRYYSKVDMNFTLRHTVHCRGFNYRKVVLRYERDIDKHTEVWDRQMVCRNL